MDYYKSRRQNERDKRIENIKELFSKMGLTLCKVRLESDCNSLVESNCSEHFHVKTNDGKMFIIVATANELDGGWLEVKEMPL